MEIYLGKQTGTGRKLSKKAAPEMPVEAIRSDIVERVLEHVSSSYRWELLEIPDAQLEICVPKKAAHKKTGSVK